MIETDVALADGRTVHVYDSGPDSADLVVYWHHGTPNIGAPPKPLFPVAAELGIRWVAHDRPGYGGSTPLPGRNLATAATDAASVADALGIERFAVLGHSGGGSHALGCAALLPDRVLAVVSAAGLAPFDAGGLDWFAGMSDASVGSLGSAARGRAAKERYEADENKPEMEFAPADLAAFDGPWAWFGEVVGPAVEPGPDALIDDDLAYVAPWGFDPATIGAPVLVLHGGMDRVVPSSHGRWLADHCPTAVLRLNPDDGHISILDSGADALRWLAGHGR